MIVRAAVTGAIDFSKSDPYDRRWVAHLNVVLAEMTRQAKVEFVSTLHQHYLAFTTIPRLEDKSYAALRDQANDALDVIINRQEPWNKDHVAKVRKDAVRAAVSEWEDHYGKLDDPAVQAAIDSTVEAVRKHRADQEMKKQAQEAIWKGRRKGTRKERHSAKRMGKRRRA